MKARYTRDQLVAKLEQMHMLVVEAEAFYAALDAAYADATWLSNDRERRTMLNRLECYSEELRKRIDALLRVSRAAIGLVLTVKKIGGSR